VELTKDEHFVVAAGGQIVTWWDLSRRRLAGQMRLGDDLQYSAAALLPSTTPRILVATTNRRTSLWQLTDDGAFEVKTQPLAEIKDFITRLAFSGDGRRLAVMTAVSDGIFPKCSVSIWDANTWQRLATIVLPPGLAVDSLQGMALSQNGDRVAFGTRKGEGIIIAEVDSDHLRFAAAAGIAASPVGLWGLRPGQGLILAPYVLAPGRDQIILRKQSAKTLAFTADAHYLALGTYDGTVAVADLAKGPDEVQTLIKGQGQRHVWKVTFSPDGKRLVAACGKRVDAGDPAENRILVWEKKLGGAWAQVEALVGHKEPVSGLAFGEKSGCLVSVAGIGPVLVWDVNGRQGLGTRITQPGESGQALAITPDQRRVVVANGHRLILFDLSTGQRIVYL
jgi:WD40 repeat protein